MTVLKPMSSHQPLKSAPGKSMLRLSLDGPLPERAERPLPQGRAITWIEDALAPLDAEMSDAAVHRVAIVIRSATGIEALVWLTDVARLSRDAVQLMRRRPAGAIAPALLRAAIAEIDAQPARRRSGR